LGDEEHDLCNAAKELSNKTKRPGYCVKAIGGNNPTGNLYRFIRASGCNGVEDAMKMKENTHLYGFEFLIIRFLNGLFV
jgi:hypothetical protein